MNAKGVEIIANASGSHHELRKLDSRLTLMKNATSKCGGVYMYSNHRLVFSSDSRSFVHFVANDQRV